MLAAACRVLWALPVGPGTTCIPDLRLRLQRPPGREGGNEQARLGSAPSPPARGLVSVSSLGLVLVGIEALLHI